MNEDPRRTYFRQFSELEKKLEVGEG